MAGVSEKYSGIVGGRACAEWGARGAQKGGGEVRGVDVSNIAEPQRKGATMSV